MTQSDPDVTDSEYNFRLRNQKQPTTKMMMRDMNQNLDDFHYGTSD